MKSFLVGYFFRKLPKNYVYIWKRLDGTPFYVGLGRNDRYKSLRRRNPHVLNVVNKMGGIEYVPKEIFEVPSWEAGCLLEKDLIAKFGRSDLGKGPLTNKTDGGEGTINKIVSIKVRQAVARSNKNRAWTESAKTAISEKMTGRLVSKKTRKKLSDIFIGKHRPQYVLDAMKAGMMRALSDGTHKWINTDKHKNHFKEVVQEKAKEWHKSEDGHEFHKKLGKESWMERKGVEVECQFCGRVFTTPYPTRAKYCHPNCKQSALRLKRGQIVGTRPNRKKDTNANNWEPKK